MRLQKIATYEAANRFLEDPYLPQHNAKYAVAPREQADYHSRLDPRLDLEQIFWLERERTVGNNWAVPYGARWLQIEAQQKRPVNAGNIVTVREHRDGSLTLLLQGTVLKWHELSERPGKPEPLPKRRVVTRPKPAPDIHSGNRFGSSDRETAQVRTNRPNRDTPTATGVQERQSQRQNR